MGKAEAALQGGTDMMGRWRVDAPAWRAFLAHEDRLAHEPDALPNDLDLNRPVPADGVEITVGTTGVVIDGTMHRLPRRSLPEVTNARLRRDGAAPPCVELHLYFPGSLAGEVTYAERRSVLRFPVAPSALRVATRFVDYYEAGRPGEADFFHGRGDGSDAEDVSTCRSCGWQTNKFVSVCERCGGSMLSRRWARRFGGAILVLGLLLAGGMGILLWSMAPTLLNPGVSIGGSRFTGSRAQATTIFVILGGVAAFGVLATLYGGWQVATGKTDKRAVYALLVLIGVVIAAAVAL